MHGKGPRLGVLATFQLRPDVLQRMNPMPNPIPPASRRTLGSSQAFWFKVLVLRSPPWGQAANANPDSHR